MLFRSPTVKMFFEDMRKMCFFYGAPMLFESQKQGIREYFESAHNEKFLLWLPGAVQPGVPSSTPTKQDLAELTEAYIEYNTQLVPFKELIDDWIDFDLDNTEKFDAAMAAGWTLYADKLLRNRFKLQKPVNLNKSRTMQKIRF